MKRSLLLMIATSCVVASLTGTAQTPALLRTFNNPAPNVDDNFGSAMAALGNDRVLIGARYDDTTATNAGAVYLFRTNGTLLTTFTNPNPASVFPYAEEQFGSAIATLGSDCICIGSPRSGKVYLFATNGTLSKTISKPNGEDEYFGAVVAAVGQDKVLIGSPRSFFNNNTWWERGAAYLFSTNGTHLMTFVNPSPEYVGDFFNPDFIGEFGISVAACGSDRVLIGANAFESGISSGLGAAYLFHINGTLLATITNPAPVLYDYFGHSVAAVGTNHLLVGAPYLEAITGITNGGSVYVFNTNGNLLTVITNPTPAESDRFGEALAALGNDRVIIGYSGDDSSATDTGSARVYGVNGNLLATINNPTPAAYDRFGHRLAAFGNEGAIIGTMYKDTGASQAGSAYLFSIPATPASPSLAIQRTTTNTIVLSWPTAAAGFVLQQNTNGASSVNWSNLTSGIQNDGTNKILVVNPTRQSCFYRLLYP